MTVIQHTYTKVTSAELSDADIFIMVALFCGVGLLASLFLACGFAGFPPELSLVVTDWI